MYSLKMEHIDMRKVQMTGGSSYIISLPKSWVKDVGIKKNESVRLVIQPDKSLLIIPSGIKDNSKMQKYKELNIDNFTDEQFFFRALIGIYISGYREIKLISSREIPSNIRNVVSKFSKTAIGVEIIEETVNEIVIRDILDPSEMPFDKVIKRMHVIVHGMYEDILHALRSRDKQQAIAVIQRDSEVDRLHWLIARQQRIASYFSATPTMGIDLLVNYFQISKIIERIGDHIVRIADNAGDIMSSTHDETIDFLLIAGEKAMQMFDEAIYAFDDKNILQAQKIIERLPALQHLCENINSIALKKKSDVAIRLGYIAESIRRTGEYSTDLCEHVIDYFI